MTWWLIPLLVGNYWIGLVLLRLCLASDFKTAHRRWPSSDEYEALMAPYEVVTHILASFWILVFVVAACWAASTSRPVRWFVSASRSVLRLLKPSTYLTSAVESGPTPDETDPVVEIPLPPPSGNPAVDVQIESLRRETDAMLQRARNEVAAARRDLGLRGSYGTTNSDATQWVWSGLRPYAQSPRRPPPPSTPPPTSEPPTPPPRDQGRGFEL